MQSSRPTARLLSRAGAELLTVPALPTEGESRGTGPPVRHLRKKGARGTGPRARQLPMKGAEVPAHPRATYRCDEGVERRPPLVVPHCDGVQLVLEPNGRRPAELLTNLGTDRRLLQCGVCVWGGGGEGVSRKAANSTVLLWNMAHEHLVSNLKHSDDTFALLLTFTK